MNRRTLAGPYQSLPIPVLPYIHRSKVNRQNTFPRSWYTFYVQLYQVHTQNTPKHTLHSQSSKTKSIKAIKSLGVNIKKEDGYGWSANCIVPHMDFRLRIEIPWYIRFSLVVKPDPLFIAMLFFGHHPSLIVSVVKKKQQACHNLPILELERLILRDEKKAIW